MSDRTERWTREDELRAGTRIVELRNVERQVCEQALAAAVAAEREAFFSEVVGYLHESSSWLGVIEGNAELITSHPDAPATQQADRLRRIREATVVLREGRESLKDWIRARAASTTDPEPRA